MTTSPSVYVAASSAEIERAEKWIQALRERGLCVTSTWPESIRRVQAERALSSTLEASNPHQATVEERRVWALENIHRISEAQYFWLLVPEAVTPSQGAYFEFGVARSLRRPSIASGGDQRFVFTALADRLFDRDEDAFEYLVALSNQHAATGGDIERLVEGTLRELQNNLPWVGTYHPDFRASLLPHRDFGHALLHVHKAGGKIAGFVDAAEHEGPSDWDQLQTRDAIGAYLADLVICALRMAQVYPYGQIDLTRAISRRLVTKNTPSSQ